MYYLISNQSQMIKFPMIDNSGNYVTGLDGALTIQISKSGGAYNPGAGVQAEIGLGVYRYTLSASETDTVGPLLVVINGAGCRQQVLEYVVESRVVGCIEYTYTVTDSVSLNPVPGVDIWVSTDNPATNIVWRGVTNAFGEARDTNNNLPCLDAGTYYFWKQRVGYSDDDNPDTEVVS